MLVKEFMFHSMSCVRNGNFLKMHVSEIRVKQIHVNQGLGVDQISRYLKRCYFRCNLIHALAKYNLESDAHSHKWGRLSVTSNQSLHLFNCSTKDKTRHSDCLYVL